jgi:prepilin-type processing-associated H-X9-DG protein
MWKFMRCPSADPSEVMYSDLSTENLLKGNYVACWGGGTQADAAPQDPNFPSVRPNQALAGVFGVVSSIKKFPTGERFGQGKGTKIGEIRDGTSNTVMYSEIISWNVPDGRTSTSHPAGMNRDVRGAMLIPQAGGNSFMTNFPPNSKGTDQLVSCEANASNPAYIPRIDSMFCTRNQQLDGQYWASARSAHPGGVNAAMSDGSVRFVKETINREVWRALGSRRGAEVLSADQY